MPSRKITPVKPLKESTIQTLYPRPRGPRKPRTYKETGPGSKTPGKILPPPLTRAELENARTNFAAAFGELGGIEALSMWGRRNRKDFYKLYAKLIPIEVNSSQTLSGTINVVSRIPDQPLTPEEAKIAGLTVNEDGSIAQ